MNKNDSNIKKDNRKALPKFLLIIVISFIFGLLMSTLKFNKGLTIKELFTNFGIIFTNNAPYTLWALTIILSLASMYYLKKAHSLFNSWDGEDEKTIADSEMKINYVILFTSINLILGFLLFGTFTLKNDSDFIPALILLAGFIVMLALTTFLQQKAVDLVRKINPEKQGSIYDSKFKDKWLASCDENEIRQIGQSSYKSYVATTLTCIILMLVTFIAKDILEFGLYPFVIIAIIWLVSTVTYIVEAIRINK